MSVDKTLTFKNGHFVSIIGGKSTVISLKAAASLREFSDSSAEKIFDRVLARHYAPPRLPQLPFLDAHQIEGVNFILSRSRAYLAHAPGAGKTAQAVVASQLIKATGRTVIIVPPTLTINWEREIIKFTEPFGVWPAIGIVPLSAKQDQMAWGADYILVPDSMLTKPWVYERLQQLKIKLLVVDEASRFKEPFAERSLALYGGRSKSYVYHGLYQQARHTVFLDGSPMPNRPMELWAPAYALNPAAIDYMSLNDFGHRYCGARINSFGRWEFRHSSNEAELHTKLQKDFMHVVGETKLNHPERKRSMLFMSEDVRSRAQRSWEEKHLKKLQIDKIDEASSQGDLARFRQQLGVRKVPWVVKYINERLTNKNESILLFAWHREVCYALAKELENWKPGLVIGGIKNDEREKTFADFQSGKIKIIIGNIQAMGRGHNLQKADRVVFAEFSWTDELNKQCEKRSSRRGNGREFIRCEYVVAPHSMDEMVLASVFTKAKRVEKVIGE